MPARSRTLDEEGVVFRAERIVRAGRFDRDGVRARFTDGPYPARRPDDNIADLEAQIAANRTGVALLGTMCVRFGDEMVSRYMQHVQRNAAACVRAAIAELRDGRFAVELDGGERISVGVVVSADRRHATVDFSGTSPASSGNFNAPPSIVRAAVLYVFRALVRQNIPLNAGCLEPLDIVIPEGCMLRPIYPAAVVAGNVETSQCITDALYGAMKVMAAAQGTMNNFTFGNERHQYYETVSGGSGAGPGFDGTDAVQTHMTNSRLTDPEVLELRYPVLLDRFEIVRGSGGKGEWCAGDGTLRVIRFLERMDCAILSGFRKARPFGLKGGAAGQPGENWVRRNNGRLERLKGSDQTVLDPGEAIIIKTPTGGGYGEPT